MGSSDPSTCRRDALTGLGQLLTGTEARELADRLEGGDTLTATLGAIGSGRRADVRSLLSAAGLGVADRERAVAVLRAVEGARATVTTVDPLWTMPGHLAQGAALTSSVTQLVAGARQSVTCSTFNVQRSSGLWAALAEAAGRPSLALRLYLDTRAADHEPDPRSPTTAEVAAVVHPGIVLLTKAFGGRRVRNHAKFLAVDHRFLLVTSANLSWSAEQSNVELGLLVDDVALTESVEREMYGSEDALYERVAAPPQGPP